MSGSLRSGEFRDLFPATRQFAWLDTPGSPPGARPVVDRVTAAVSEWSSGAFDWHRWDGEPQRGRLLFAELFGVEADQVALMSSVSEAAATVAASLPSGRIVMLESEYRSVVLPFASLRSPDCLLTLAPTRADNDRTASLIDAITADTVLVAVSEVLSSDGVRVDLAAVRRAADTVGARLFVDATQSFGVLATDHPSLGADYVAIHGYKWLLCPRGAAWLVSRADRVGELLPLAPGWKSTALPHGYFGSADLASTAMRLDASPAWLSWIGACAALELHGRLDYIHVEKHVCALTARFVRAARELGYSSPAHGLPSHIAVLTFPDLPGLPTSLIDHHIKATATSTRLRVGVHYFNNQSDFDRVLDVLAEFAPRLQSRSAT